MQVQAREHPEVALLHERIEGNLTLVGLTGGIACGKSIVSGMFRELGVPVIDADQIARDVVRPGEPAYGKIVETFGDEILNDDKTINRERLGTLVFADDGKRKALEDITHPRIFRAIADEVHRLRIERGARAVVVDAALLFESGLDDSMDKNIVVSAPEDVQRSRLMARDGLSEEAARARIAAQMPTAEKTEKAHVVIDNSGDLEETRRAVAEVAAAFREIP